MTVYGNYLVSPEAEARMSRFAAFLIGLLVLAPLVVPPMVFGAGGPPPLRAEDPILLFLFFTARRQNARLGRRAFSTILSVGTCIWLVYVLTQTIGVLLTLVGHPDNFIVNSLYTPLMYARNTLIFITVGSLHLQPRHLWQLVGFLALLGAAEMFLGMMQAYWPNPFTAFIFRYVRGSNLDPGRFIRSYGTLPNPNYYGGVLAVFASFSLALGLCAKKKLFRIFGIASALLMAYAGFILAQSRTCLFSMSLVIISVLTMSLFLPRGRWMPVLVMIGLVLLVIVGVGLLQTVELPARITDFFDSVRTHGVTTGVSQSTGRLELWENQLELLGTSGNYLFGAGSSKLNQENFDSGFLGALMTGGLIGLAAHCGLYFFMVWTSIATLLRGRNGAYAPSALALIGASLAMLTFEVTSGFIITPSLSVIQAATMGLVALTRREVDDEIAAQEEAEMYGQNWRSEEWSGEPQL